MNILRWFFIFTSLSKPFLCYVINYDQMKMLAHNDSRYFGYAVLLQQGNSPLVIVGAPKTVRLNQSKGALFKCNLDNLTCMEYTNIKSRQKGIYQQGRGGDFFGGSVVGDEVAGGKIFTSTPRLVSTDRMNGHLNNYFMVGECFGLNNSTNMHRAFDTFVPLTTSRTRVKDSVAFYDSAFAEAGFDLAYLKEKNELIIGAPGKALAIGASIHWNFRYGETQLLADKLDFKRSDTYFGYSMSYGRFLRGVDEIWYVAGAPRGSALKGEVMLYKNERHTFALKERLFGEELGSYFGASLLVIHKAHTGDDILIGAPMHSGNSWDEGRVYYYRNRNGGFEAPLKLSGRQTGSRFGTVIADMGDIDLDSFHDIAIAAPYEDGGAGAVYLYYGTKTGFSASNYHRISPENFHLSPSSRPVRGFGIGISKGVDMNGDVHHDVVIGAYKSNQIFYFTSHYVIDFKEQITSSENILYTTTRSFTVTYCLSYVARNNLSITLNVDAMLIIDDARILSNKTEGVQFELKHNTTKCKVENLMLKKFVNIDPLRISLSRKYVSESDYKIVKTLEIPVSYGCGDDNICQTDLSIAASWGEIDSIVLGEHDELTLTVKVENAGETAYLTQIHISIPPQISIINLRECYFDNLNESYVCPVADDVMKTAVQKSFVLDLSRLKAGDQDNIVINISISSLGVDINPANNKIRTSLPVTLRNSPYIVSESQPDVVLWNKTQEILHLKHLFTVGNMGPSPVDLNVAILVPQFKVDGDKELFEIARVEGIFDEIAIECAPRNRTVRYSFVLPATNRSKTSLNCFNDSGNCAEIFCRGGFFSKSSENALFLLDVAVHVRDLAENVENQDVVDFVSSIFLHNSTHIIHVYSSTLIYGLSKNAGIALWIYAVSITLGFLLLILLIFILYKFHFFERTYREKLQNEQYHVELADLVEECSDEE